MRIVGLCSPSHEVLRDRWFLPTVPEGFDVDLRHIEQISVSGDFGSTGWTETMAYKMDVVQRAILDYPGEIMVLSDLDVRFFELRPAEIEQELGDAEIAFQRNSVDGEVCSGFVVFRSCDAVRSLVEQAREMIDLRQAAGDQEAINHLLGVRPRLRRKALGLLPRRLGDSGSRAADWLYRAGRFTEVVRWKYLSRRYWNPGQEGTPYWEPGHRLRVPDGIAVHHANWTVGIPNKLAQLEMVDRIVRAREGSAN